MFYYYIYYSLDLFISLEEGSKQFFTAPKFGIISYGVSMTTLEEVFLKIGDDEGSREEKPEQDGGDSNDEENKGIVNSPADNMGLETDAHLTINDASLTGSSTNLHNSSLDLHPAEYNLPTGIKEVSLWIQLMALLEVCSLFYEGEIDVAPS